MSAENQVFDRAAVTAPHRAAAETGRSVLAAGGNAIEATVAMAATVAVAYPHMNGLGGDGVWLIREPGGRVRAIEAAGPAGQCASSARYRALGHETVPAQGPLAAATVPGTVGGWALAVDLARHLGGRLPLRDLLGDAGRLAREGCPVSPSEARVASCAIAALREVPGFARAYLDGEGKPPPAGAPRRNEALAATLDQLAHAGLDDFYRGDIGREVAADAEAIGAGFTRADLEGYRATWREPLALSLPGRVHDSAPSPQGLANLVLLGIFDRLAVTRPEDFAHVHGLVEAAKRALAIRDRLSTGYAQPLHAPQDVLTPDALGREAGRIDMTRAAAIPLRTAPGSGVWLGAIDGSGLAVSFGQSLHGPYGSGCVLPRTGLLLHNHGSAFSLEPGAANPLEPGHRPIHTANAALATFDDGRVVSYGATGGDGQPQVEAQIFTRLLLGQSVGAAIDRPRFLVGRTGEPATTGLCCEPRFDDSLVAALRRAGHEVDVGREEDDAFGHAGMLVRRKDGRIEAAHDPRSDGGAAGI